MTRWWEKPPPPQDPAPDAPASSPDAPAPPAPPRDLAPIDRAAFLRRGLGALRDLSARVGHLALAPVINRVAPPLLRPPGALDEEAFFSACTRCGACVEACHQDTILIAGVGHGVHAATPYLDVNHHKPCYLCLTPPCSAACPSGALRPITHLQIKLGAAVIDRHVCLAWNNQSCSRCADRCPDDLAAVLSSDHGRPVVDPDRCTGCGLCVRACPASAILVHPT